MYMVLQNEPTDAETSQGIADQIAKLAKLRDDHVVSQDEFEAGKARLLGKSKKGRIWEGVVWYVAFASAIWTVIAIAAGGEASYEGDAQPWWFWAMLTAGFTFWALHLRKRRRSPGTRDDPAS